MTDRWITVNRQQWERIKESPHLILRGSYQPDVECADHEVGRMARVLENAGTVVTIHFILASQ